MIILDTNVVSESTRPQGSPHVQGWLNAQASETLYLTATSLAELLLGTELLPKGKRKDAMEAELHRLVRRLFGARILSFDQAAALAYAELVSRARSKGRPIAVADGQIAAIAKLHGFTVATRDTSPFEVAGVSVVNPWLA